MVDYLSKADTQAANTASKMDAVLRNAIVDQDGNTIPVNGKASITWSKFPDFARTSKTLTGTAAKARMQQLNGVTAGTRRYTMWNTL